ncbi:hypothetical protein GE09DRAFT_1121419 [Coniochaeta sp. 2T2.1]|nr:hypothetical protein GE09DRAFT_1121419 [Coniochaeta sp. 2T2.1]
MSWQLKMLFCHLLAGRRLSVSSAVCCRPSRSEGTTQPARALVRKYWIRRGTGVDGVVPPTIWTSRGGRHAAPPTLYYGTRPASSKSSLAPTNRLNGRRSALLHYCEKVSAAALSQGYIARLEAGS